ncbi:hypothetical protein L2E82_44558 [Cichorium intybus]|uniref:Uncharacterized protein n=1 Tax=Cichorium intybus TaxID=13427 RepID=A0ACB8ZRV6_CICIN|nr:hypothetical protein L2E82_44558 [Cichorium intybus]
MFKNEIQMMINQKSYHVVNSEKWAPGRQPKQFEDLNQFQELKEDEIKPNVINSLSEANLNLNPKPHLIGIRKRGNTNTEHKEEKVFQVSHIRLCVKEPDTQPSQLLILGDTIPNVREVKTYESASALSLANFTSLLIEFVTRLQNLMSAFEENSEKAKFSDPMNPLEAKETMGLWTRVVDFFSRYKAEMKHKSADIIAKQQEFHDDAKDFGMMEMGLRSFILLKAYKNRANRFNLLF